MPSAPSSRVFGSLRFRLTLYNTGVILALSLLVFLGLHQGMRAIAQHELDRRLRADLDEARSVLGRHRGDLAQAKAELDRMSIAHPAQHWFVRFFVVEGGEEDEGVFSERVRTTGAPRLDALPTDTDEVPFTRDGWRMVQGVGRLGPDRIICVGCRQDYVEDDVRMLRFILLVAGGVIVFVAPPVGYWLAGRAIEPLAAIASTAERIRPDRLGERIVPRGTGDELDRLAATLNGLFDRIATHVERQRSFVANAAHELRSPLAALRASAEVALAQDRSADAYREVLADIIESGEGLTLLVNQLLLLAETESGLAVGDAAVDLAEKARRTVDMFGGLAESRGLSLTLDAPRPAFVRGSKVHLRQVVSNLVDNAIKFTPPGGSVSVRVVRESDTVVAEVADTGRGIASDDLERVFERFYRVDRVRSRESPVGGTGLGLSICRALVEAHGGTITLSSEPGRGTRVVVRLPAAGAGSQLAEA